MDDGLLAAGIEHRGDGSDALPGAIDALLQNVADVGV